MKIGQGSASHRGECQCTEMYNYCKYNAVSKSCSMCLINKKKFDRLPDKCSDSSTTAFTSAV